MYNFNKTKFKAGCKRQQKVITKVKTTYVVLKNPENRNSISLLKCVSRNRLVIPNIIILNRKNHLKQFFLYNNLDEKVVIAVSDKRYNNNKFSFYWVEHFDKYIYKKIKMI